MIDLDPTALAQAINMSGALNVRTTGFEIPTFDLLKGAQRELESYIRRGTSNAEVLKMHPEARSVE